MINLPCKGPAGKTVRRRITDLAHYARSADPCYHKNIREAEKCG